jgi:hypothetical protein
MSGGLNPSAPPPRTIASRACERRIQLRPEYPERMALYGIAQAVPNAPKDGT